MIICILIIFIYKPFLLHSEQNRPTCSLWQAVHQGYLNIAQKIVSVQTVLYIRRLLKSMLLLTQSTPATHKAGGAHLASTISIEVSFSPLLCQFFSVVSVGLPVLKTWYSLFFHCLTMMILKVAFLFNVLFIFDRL